MKKYYFRILFFGSISALLIVSYFNYVHKQEIKLIFQNLIDEKQIGKINIEYPGHVIQVPSKPIILEAIVGPKQENNLFCIILTSKKTIFERCNAMYDTWAKNCTKTVFACNCKDMQRNLTDKENELLKKINILHLPINESYNRMAEKILITLKIVFNIFGEKFNWFLLVDDDTFIYTRNVFKFINSHDSKQPFTYGYNFKAVVPTGYHSGGGGNCIL